MSGEAPVQVGEVLAQKYRVDRILGVGGMGVVVAATHLQLDQKVALKFMLREAFANEDALARFTREARAAVKLKSEHVARVSDTGTFENGSPYIVMEYLDGTDLVGELEKRGPLPLADVAEYIIQACDALAEAHNLGIVHRDLKPANLFLSRRNDGSPIVKVLDFGISKASPLAEGGVELTKTASMMGSPLYMSPEQIRSSKDVDARTDVWSLGVIMHQLLTAAVPFNAETMGGLLTLVMMEPPPPLQPLRPDLPPEICALVARCLEKPLANRCQNVGEIVIGLAPYCPARSMPLVNRISSVMGVRMPTSVPLSPISSPMSRSIATAPTAAAAVPGSQTGDPWAATGRDPRIPQQPNRTSSAVWLVPLVLVAMGAIGATAFFGLRQHKTTIAASTDLGPLPTIALSPPSASAVAQSVVAPAPPQISLDAGTGVASATPPEKAPMPAVAAVQNHPRPQLPQSHGDAHALAPTTQPASPKPTANCNPAFTIDPDGRKIPKPECL